MPSWQTALLIGSIAGQQLVLCCASELNPAYDVKCTFHCNSLFQHVSDWRSSKLNCPLALFIGFSVVQSLKNALTNVS